MDGIGFKESKDGITSDLLLSGDEKKLIFLDDYLDMVLALGNNEN